MVSRLRSNGTSALVDGDPGRTATNPVSVSHTSTMLARRDTRRNPLISSARRVYSTVGVSLADWGPVVVRRPYQGVIQTSVTWGRIRYSHSCLGNKDMVTCTGFSRMRMRSNYSHMCAYCSLNPDCLENLTCHDKSAHRSEALFSSSARRRSHKLSPL